MPNKTKSYRDWLNEKLSDPARASRYLNKALEDSEPMFLKALRKVALSQSRTMTDLARECEVSRESLYRMLSENGNPTSENRRAILAAMGLKSIVVPIEFQAPSPDYRTTVRSSFGNGEFGQVIGDGNKHLAMASGTQQNGNSSPKFSDIFISLGATGSVTAQKANAPAWTSGNNSGIAILKRGETPVWQTEQMYNLPA
jgi:probable addiction module antidote protein